MPPPWVYEGTDGVLMLYNGVTRATRIAKLAPGTLIRVEVIGKLPKAFAGEPTAFQGILSHRRPVQVSMVVRQLGESPMGLLSWFSAADVPRRENMRMTVVVSLAAAHCGNTCMAH